MKPGHYLKMAILEKFSLSLIITKFFIRKYKILELVIFCYLYHRSLLRYNHGFNILVHNMQLDACALNLG
jgi:hypothetical protein